MFGLCRCLAAVAADVRRPGLDLGVSYAHPELNSTVAYSELSDLMVVVMYIGSLDSMYVVVCVQSKDVRSRSRCRVDADVLTLKRRDPQHGPLGLVYDQRRATIDTPGTANTYPGGTCGISPTPLL
jgi:hypothetical protein